MAKKVKINTEEAKNDLEDLDYNLNDILQEKKNKGLNPRMSAIKSV